MLEAAKRTLYLTQHYEQDRSKFDYIVRQCEAIEETEGGSADGKIFGQRVLSVERLEEGYLRNGAHNWLNDHVSIAGRFEMNSVITLNEHRVYEVTSNIKYEYLQAQAEAAMNLQAQQEAAMMVEPTTTQVEPTSTQGEPVSTQGEPSSQGEPLSSLLSTQGF